MFCFTAFTEFGCSWYVSNCLNVFKELYVYFTVKYVNILNYENSVNRTGIAKKRIIFRLTIKQTSQKLIQWSMIQLHSIWEKVYNV